MPYNLHMSPAQLARCDRALGAPLTAARITRTVRGREFQDDAVVLDAQGIQRIIDALRASPEPCDTQEPGPDASLEDLNLAYLADTLELVLAEGDDDPNILHGVCL